MRKAKLYITEKYTKEILEPIVKASINYTDVCRKFGITSTGSAWRYIKNKIKEHDIDISHFLGKSTHGGYRNSYINKIALKKEEVLVLKENKIKTSSKILRRAMLQSNVDYKCHICELNKWRENSLTLEIHHIDGNNCNNVLDNLQLLCPNCHSQTENYGKNKMVIVV